MSSSVGSKEGGSRQYAPLSCLTKLGYSVGHVLNDLCAAFWFTYAPIFYSVVAGFGNFETGALIFIGQIVDAFATPPIGMWSDKYSLYGLSYFGKRKSWYLLGTVIVTASVPFMYSPCIMCSNAKEIYQLIYYSIFVSLFQIGWAATQTVHLALSSDLSYVDDTRTTLLSLRNTFTVISNIIVYVITFTVLKFNSSSQLSGKKDIISFQLTVLALLILGVASSIFFFIFVKEKRKKGQKEEEINSRTYRELFSKLDLYHTAFIYMTTRICCNVMQSVIALYIQHDLRLESTALAIIPLVMYISSGIFSLILPKITHIIGKKVLFTVGGLLSIIACVCIFFARSNLYKHQFIYFVAAIAGASNALMLVTAYSLTNDFIGLDVGNGAFIYGLMSFVDKLSFGVIILLIMNL